MNVLHISTADTVGGSARSAYRIHRSLQRLGHRSRMLVRTRITDDPDVGYVHGGRRLVWALDLVGRFAVDEMGLQYLMYPSSHLLARHPWVTAADVVQLYNTHGGYFSHLALPALSRRRPVVWRLSDMWPLTGHCIYSYACERWRTGCGACPILDDYPALPWDTTALLWRVKKQIYQRSKLVVVATNSWMASVVRGSPLLGQFPLRIIPNGVDADVFRPVPKVSARESLGIPPDARVVLFSGHVATTGTRKGGEHVQPVLERLLDAGVKNLLLVVLGERAEAWEDSPRYPTVRLGATQSDRLLACVYAAADVMLFPALVDNLPNGVLESMACGTPVVAFAVGGIREVIRHGETGYLARERDSEDLARGLQAILEGPKPHAELSDACRRTIETCYTLELEARRFANLYEEVRQTPKQR